VQADWGLSKLEVPDDALWSAVKGAMTLIAADTAWNVTQGSVTCVIGCTGCSNVLEFGALPLNVLEFGGLFAGAACLVNAVRH
jgi:hypothetical protein